MNKIGVMELITGIILLMLSVTIMNLTTPTSMLTIIVGILIAFGIIFTLTGIATLFASDSDSSNVKGEQ
jgi:hypothetical protein